MTPEMMAELLLRQALSQHAAGLYRASSKTSADAAAAVSTLGDPVIAALAMRISDLTPYDAAALCRGDLPSPATRAVHMLVEQFANDLRAHVDSTIREQGLALYTHESQYAAGSLARVLTDIKDPNVNVKQAFTVAMKQPVVGKLYDDMLDDMAAGAKAQVWQTVRRTISAGETTQSIVASLRGTKAAGFKDGALNLTRNAITTLVRTTRTHISAAAYADTYSAMGVTQVQVCATLDGRTSVYCATHDGEVYDLGSPFPAPPYHQNCRTVLLPVIRGAGFKVRPYIADKRALRDIPPDQRDGRVGQTTGATFGTWFAEQSAEFQREWLGPTRYALYSQGDYTLDRFVDPRGKQYTIEQLRERDAHTFNSIFGE